MAKILVVEDERIVAADIKDTLVQLGYDVVATVATGEDAVKAVDRLRPDLVMMDIHLGPGIDGVEAADQIRLRHTTPVIFLTAYTDDETLMRAKITEPFGYIVKPFEDREIHTAIEIGLYRHRVEAEMNRLNGWLSTLLRCMGDGVIGLDDKGRVNYANPHAAEMLGTSVDEMSGRPWREVLQGDRPQDQNLLQSAIEFAGASGPRSRIPSGTLLKVEGRPSFPISATVAPTSDGVGTITGTVVVVHDLRLANEVDSLRSEVRQLRARLKDRASQLI